MSTDLADIVADPGRIRELGADRVPALLAAIEGIRAALWRQLLAPSEPERRRIDELLTIREAARVLATTVDWLRRHPELPFRVELSPGQVRFSAAGIERFIRQRAGRE